MWAGPGQEKKGLNFLIDPCDIPDIQKKILTIQKHVLVEVCNLQVLSDSV